MINFAQSEGYFKDEIHGTFYTLWPYFQLVGRVEFKYENMKTYMLDRGGLGTENVCW